ncbi:MAG: hypothetical protein Q8K32_24660 [Archangium sp.]|nr:hypothetical protein [Archangium sp.]
MAKRNQTLTDAQRVELKTVLRIKREEIRARQLELAERNDSDFEPDPMDTADAATAATAGHEDEALSAHDRWLLGEIESALGRLDGGRYGLSEGSGEPISYERLRSIPWARRTAEEEEEAARSVQSPR